MIKNKYENRKRNRKRNTTPSHNNSKAKGGGKQTERNKNCAKWGYIIAKKPATTNSAQTEMSG